MNCRTASSVCGDVGFAAMELDDPLVANAAVPVVVAVMVPPPNVAVLLLLPPPRLDEENEEVRDMDAVAGEPGVTVDDEDGSCGG